MKNYDRFVLNSMRPTIANTRQNFLASVLNRIAVMVARMFNRSG
jgi:hypothetical protein